MLSALFLLLSVLLYGFILAVLLVKAADVEHHSDTNLQDTAPQAGSEDDVPVVRRVA